jgi:hypothetical protein
MSKSKFKKDYWHSKLKAKIESVQNDLTKAVKSEDFNDNLKMINNEFRKESLENPDLKFPYTEKLVPEEIDGDIIKEAFVYLENIRKYYIRYYNNASGQKDELVTKLQAADNAGFLKLKNDYANESLREFVTNSNETDKIIEYNDEIVQKLEPIYMEPKHPFIRSHFYSPVKNVLGLRMDTYTVNVFVLWLMTFCLYLALYFRILKKALDSGGAIMDTKKRNSGE